MPIQRTLKLNIKYKFWVKPFMGLAKTYYKLTGREPDMVEIKKIIRKGIKVYHEKPSRKARSQIQ